MQPHVLEFNGRAKDEIAEKAELRNGSKLIVLGLPARLIVQSVREALNFRCERCLCLSPLNTALLPNLKIALGYVTYHWSDGQARQQKAMLSR